MATIGLAMLVKNERESLPTTIERIKPAVDSWTVMDTGSSDGSQDLACELLADLPGELVERPFDGFGPSRTALLQAAADKAEYTLMLDADHILHIHGDKPSLTADSYLIPVRNGGLSWRLPLLTRSAHPFEYRGVAHAYLATNQQATSANLDWVSIDGGGGASRDKLERDRILLEQAHADDPTDTRTCFYLAQTYRDLDMPLEAIRLYLLRAEMGGYEEERWFARYQAGVLLGAHVEGLQGAEQLVKAWRERPSRAEALRALARLADAVADKLDQPDDALFVIPSAYRKAA